MLNFCLIYNPNLQTIYSQNFRNYFSHSLNIKVFSVFILESQKSSKKSDGKSFASNSSIATNKLRLSNCFKSRTLKETLTSIAFLNNQEKRVKKIKIMFRKVS